MNESEALDLLLNEDFITLGKRAHKMRTALHPDNLVTFVIDRNINYTNICRNACRFCAFYRDVDSTEGYLLGLDAIVQKVGELVEKGGTQVLIQGGLNPSVDLPYIENMFRTIKSVYPSVIIHSLSPAEILFLSEQSGIGLDAVVERLRNAGLESMPGGGAEILVDSFRNAVSPKKICSEEWLTVMRAGARQGMKGTATMMFGGGEIPQDVISHMTTIKRFQDETEGFFRAFIPWTYQPGNTDLGGNKTSALYYLRVLATARLYLDNIANIQASWVTQGPKISQTALFFGANDMGGTMLEENVVAAAGTQFMMERAEIEALISEIGFTPSVRNTRYEIL